MPKYGLVQLKNVQADLTSYREITSIRAQTDTLISDTNRNIQTQLSKALMSHQYLVQTSLFPLRKSNVGAELEFLRRVWLGIGLGDVPSDEVSPHCILYRVCTLIILSGIVFLPCWEIIFKMLN